jgi:hypothetical protein
MTRKDIIPSRGAVAEPLLLEVTRALTADDLGRLSEAPKVGVPLLKKLRAVHHQQAQLLASGKSVKDVAAIIGCTTQRIIQLQTDPSFNDLVQYYRDQTMVTMLEDTARIQRKLVDVGEIAIDEIRDRLEDDAKLGSMDVKELRQIAQFAMDRTVAPPKAVQNQPAPAAAITINFGTKVGNPANEGPIIDAESEG